MTLRSVRHAVPAALILLAAAMLAPTATAGRASLLGCPGQTVQTPFAAWGDKSKYVLAPNGGFESGASGWKLTGGAAVATGSEPFAVRAPGDRYSLSIPPKGSATSSDACVSLTDAKLRYFVTNTGSTPATVKIEVLYKTLLGLIKVREAGKVQVPAKASWAPAQPKYFLAGIVGLLALDPALTTTKIQLRFTVTGANSAVRIDDVYVDPIKIL